MLEIVLRYEGALNLVEFYCVLECAMAGTLDESVKNSRTLGAGIDCAGATNFKIEGLKVLLFSISLYRASNSSFFKLYYSLTVPEYLSNTFSNLI